MSSSNSAHLRLMSALEGVEIDCNSSSGSDTHGWDVYGEIQGIRQSASILESSRKRHFKIQVKSSAVGEDSIRIKLLPLVKLLHDPLPSFIVFMSKERGRSDFSRISICHVDISIMKVAREIYEKLGNDRPNKKWVPIPSDYITSMPLDEVGMRHLRNYIVGAMDLYGDDYSEVKGNDYQRTLGAVLRKFDIDSGGSNCRIKVSGKGKQVTIDANLSQIGEDDFFATSGILRFACSRSDVEGQLWDFGAEVTLEELSKTIRARQITSREHTITVESTEFRVTHIGTPGSIERDLKTDYELEEFILKVQSACDKSGLRPVEPIAMDNIGGILFGRKSRHILHVKGGKMKLPHKVTATGHHTFHLADTLEMAGVFIEILTQFRTVTRGPFEEGQLVDVSPLHPSKVLAFSTHEKREASYALRAGRMAREVLIEDIFVSGSDLDDLPDIRDRRIRRNIE